MVPTNSGGVMKAPLAVIIYHEFRGVRTPADDIGEPGDIYVDLTPDAYSLYMMMQGWTAYERMPLHIIQGDQGCKGDWNELSHPFLAHIYLWVSIRKGVVWTTCESIRDDVLCEGMICTVHEHLKLFIAPHFTGHGIRMFRAGETAGSKRSQSVDGDTNRDSRMKRPRVDEPSNSVHVRNIDETQSGVSCTLSRSYATC